MGYKRFYVTGSLSLLAIFALIAPFIETYYGYEEVVVCDEDCFVEFCMKNGAKNLYFYNKEGLPLTFEPESAVKSVEFFKKDSRYKEGYREIDFITPYTKGVNYVFKIPAYTSTCYGMHIIKESGVDVKWTFAGLDPWIVSTGKANLSFDVHPCWLNVSLGNCFAINFSKAFDSVNWSNNKTIQSGNFTFNFTDLNVSIVGDYLLNLTVNKTGNQTGNITVRIKLNQTNTTRWQLFFGDTNLTSTTWVGLVNLTPNMTRQVNFTLNVYNVSGRYVNWTLQGAPFNFEFNISLNATPT